MEFSNSLFLISAKIGMSSPPNLGGSTINFFSILLQKTPPVMAGMNLDCTTSSKRLSCVDAPEIVRMQKEILCWNPVVNALYAACGWVLAICERIRSCAIHSFTFEERYSSLYFVDPNEAPKWHFPSVVICTPLPWKMFSAFPSTSGLIMSTISRPVESIRILDLTHTTDPTNTSIQEYNQLQWDHLHMLLISMCLQRNEISLVYLNIT